MLLNIFSPLAGGNLSTMYYPEQRLLAMNAGQNYSRNEPGNQLFPYPQMCGALPGFCRIDNNVELFLMQGKLPYGPWSGKPAMNPVDVFKNFFGGMTKVSG